MSSRPTQRDLELAWLMLKVINELREDEGSSVTILCDNPDFEGPANAVVCCGEWTKWKEARFSGETLDQALADALGSYHIARRGGT